MHIENLKKLAASKAVDEIKPGMVVGLGTGSTFKFALEIIADKFREGVLNNIECVASSDWTEAEAKRLGLHVINLGCATPRHTDKAYKLIDIYIDGADEVDDELNLIKGGGGALLKEKILAQASKRFVVIVDESKLSKKLGEKFYVPVEVIKSAADVEIEFLRAMGAKAILRKKAEGGIFITDENNYIIDANFGVIDDVNKIAKVMNERAGIVEHGLFLNMADVVYCSLSDGSVRTFNRTRMNTDWL